MSKSKNSVLNDYKKAVRTTLRCRDNKQHHLNRRMLEREFRLNTEVFCKWCNNPVYRAIGKVNKENDATVDHIYEKNDIRRTLVTEEENTVISCRKCNSDRAELERTKRKYIFDGSEIINLFNLCTQLF